MRVHALNCASRGGDGTLMVGRRYPIKVHLALDIVLDMGWCALSMHVGVRMPRIGRSPVHDWLVFIPRRLSIDRVMT